MRVPVTPDTAVATWALHYLDLAGARPARSPAGAPVLAARVDGESDGWTYVRPAEGLHAVRVERDGDGWAWIVEEDRYRCPECGCGVRSSHKMSCDTGAVLRRVAAEGGGES